MAQLTGDTGDGGWNLDPWNAAGSKFGGSYPGFNSDPSGKFNLSPSLSSQQAAAWWLGGQSQTPAAPGLVYSQGQSSQSIWDEIAAAQAGLGQGLNNFQHFGPTPAQVGGGILGGLGQSAAGIAGSVVTGGNPSGQVDTKGLMILGIVGIGIFAALDALK